MISTCFFCYRLLSFDDILNILSTDGLIPMESVHIARNFIAGCQFDRVSIPLSVASFPKLTLKPFSTSM